MVKFVRRGLTTSEFMLYPEFSHIGHELLAVPEVQGALEILTGLYMTDFSHIKKACCVFSAPLCGAGGRGQCVCPDSETLHQSKPPGPGCSRRPPEHLPNQPDAV